MKTRYILSIGLSLLGIGLISFSAYQFGKQHAEQDFFSGYTEGCKDESKIETENYQRNLVVSGYLGYWFGYCDGAHDVQSLACSIFYNKVADNPYQIVVLNHNEPLATKIVLEAERQGQSSK